MAISQDIWDKAKALFEMGKSLSDIAKETGISKGQISKKSKVEVWKKETMKQLVSLDVHNTINANEIRKQKETLNATQQEVYNQEFISLSHSLGLFQNSTQKNQQAINKIQDEILEDASREDLFDLAAISKITETNRKQLFGITEAFKDDTSDEDEEFVLL
ncbi:MAG: hypothetical protein J7L21_05975 [Sulfurimonas sp.]|nr:hypothetical protein [Sulfurimonas sp.]